MLTQTVSLKPISQSILTRENLQIQFFKSQTNQQFSFGVQLAAAQLIPETFIVSAQIFFLQSSLLLQYSLQRKSQIFNLNFP